MSQKSKVLALKYRPSSFGDLIGQDIISETIINSIKADKIPNAYLLRGLEVLVKLLLQNCSQSSKL